MSIKQPGVYLRFMSTHEGVMVVRGGMVIREGMVPILLLWNIWFNPLPRVTLAGVCREILPPGYASTSFIFSKFTSLYI